MSDIRVGSYSVSVLKRLAEGGFGFVDLVYDSRSRQEFVLKRCGIVNPESLTIAQKEVNILQKFANPYIVKIFGNEVIHTRSTQEAVILMEYCPGGTLLDLLRARKDQPLLEREIFRIFGQCLMGLKPLHENPVPVTHRDLKLENILFGSDKNVRLCDFGSCVFGPVNVSTPDLRSAAEEIIAKETTQMYRSPELVDLYMRDVLTIKSDIWALGCIYYTLCFLKHPFQDAGNLGILNENIHIPVAQNVSESSRILISRMLDFDPEARPSIAQLIDAVSALSQGRELPPFSIPPEALQWKENRKRALEAAKERQKNQKKGYVAKVPVRKVAVPLVTNSVAARRLAAKGVPLPQSASSFSAPQKSTISSGRHSFSSMQTSSSNEFDPFSSGPMLENKAESFKPDNFGNTQSFGFDSFSAEPALTSDSFNPFSSPTAEASNPTPNSEYDPFAVSAIATSFQSPTKGTSNFDSWSQSIDSFQNMSISESKPSSTVNSQFIPFDSFESGASKFSSPAPASNPSGSMQSPPPNFDPFDVKTIASFDFNQRSAPISTDFGAFSSTAVPLSSFTPPNNKLGSQQELFTPPKNEFNWSQQDNKASVKAEIDGSSLLLQFTSPAGTSFNSNPSLSSSSSKIIQDQRDLTVLSEPSGNRSVGVQVNVNDSQNDFYLYVSSKTTKGASIPSSPMLGTPSMMTQNTLSWSPQVTQFNTASPQTGNFGTSAKRGSIKYNAPTDPFQSLIY